MGEPFGHYELLQPLATGGMGQLYLARTRAEGFQKLLTIAGQNFDSDWRLLGNLKVTQQN